MGHQPVSRRTFLSLTSVVATATALPHATGALSAAAAPSTRHPFGRYGSPDDRLDAGTRYVHPAGIGDHTSVQEAVDAAGPGATLVLAPGTYRELVRIPSSLAGLTLIGAADDPRRVTIVYDLAAGKPDPDGSGSVGTTGSATVQTRAARLTATGITFANDFLRAEHPEISSTQAVTIKVQGDRSAFERCRFLGHQDTLYADSPDSAVPARQYYRHCYVEGDVDFIFGRGTAVFDQCEIHLLDRDVDFTPKGMPFAPSTSREFAHGFLVTGCRVSSSAGPGEYKISRPWVPSSNSTARPALTVRESWLGPGVDAEEPYTNMRDEHPWQEMRYYEHANVGTGAVVHDPASRPPQLSPAEAEAHTVATYLGDWAPQDGELLPVPVTQQLSVYVAGDSTASTYGRERAPRAGWAQALPLLAGPGTSVVNRAWSGRSSKSYADELALDRIARELRTGDALLVSFGHNDQKVEDPARGTDPWGSYQTHLRTYLAAARTAGATPVLVTSVERRRFRDGRAVESLSEYPAAMRDLAEREGVLLVDLQADSLRLWDEAGVEGTRDYFLWLDPGEHPNYPGGVEDNTHFQAYGAIEVARLVAREARRQELGHARSWQGTERQLSPDDVRWPREEPVPV